MKKNSPNVATHLLENPAQYVLKIIPFVKFSQHQIQNQLKRILFFLEDENFTTDVITSYWENPQIDLIYELKKQFINVKTSMVIHVMKYIGDINLRTKLLYFNSIGFRNKTLMDKFIKNYKTDFHSFYICYSGLPDDFLKNINHKNIPFKFENNLLSIIYVGLFIKRKYPESIVKAVYKINDKINAKIDFIGEGNEQNNVKILVNRYKLGDKVKFHNRIIRGDVQNILKESQVFVMISKDEAFGLVYLEAMACGCIVVASRNEGFDGIINDGFNGFLCQVGDELELSEILLKIYNLSIDDKYLISKNAIDTASSLTNGNVSEKYLNAILNETIY